MPSPTLLRSATRALETIKDRKHWTKGSLRKISYDGNWEYCVLGAVWHGAYPDDIYIQYPSLYDRDSAAKELTEKLYDTLVENRAMRPAWSLTEEEPSFYKKSDAIVVFNDDPTDHHEEIVEALESIIYEAAGLA